MDKELSWDYDEFWRQKEARNKFPQPAGFGCWWEVSGKSSGYWVEIARSRPEREREAERQHETRFGPYWAVNKVKRPNGRSYTTRQSPYDPEPGYAGIWKGRTAPPPRIGAAAPKRWPTEAPDGLRPHEYKWAQVLASRLITDRLRLSGDRYNCQRLRDLRAHIHERACFSGAAFQNEKKWPKKFPNTKFARGIRWAEIEGIELYRRHDQLRWFVDARFEADNDVPFIDGAIADSAGYGFQEVNNTVARRRRKYGRPLRERRKAGRKPLGERAMTTAERVAKHRARKKLPALATHERVPAGADQPLPLGLAVPVPPFASTDEGSAMSELATLSVEAALSSASRNAEPTAGPRRYPTDAAGHSGADIFAGLMAAYTRTPARLSRQPDTPTN